MDTTHNGEESLAVRLKWAAEAFDEFGYAVEAANVREVFAPAAWTDGEPQNLAAAVADASEWIELLVRRSDWLNVENRERCRRALMALNRLSAPPEKGQFLSTSVTEREP